MEKFFHEETVANLENFSHICEIACSPDGYFHLICEN